MAELQGEYHYEDDRSYDGLFTFEQRRLYEYMRDLYATRAPHARHILEHAHREVKHELIELELDAEWRLRQAWKRLLPYQLVTVADAVWDMNDIGNN